jgi:hypothetical protein
MTNATAASSPIRLTAAGLAHVGTNLKLRVTAWGNDITVNADGSSSVTQQEWVVLSRVKNANGESLFELSGSPLAGATAGAAPAASPAPAPAAAKPAAAPAAAPAVAEPPPPAALKSAGMKVAVPENPDAKFEKLQAAVEQAEEALREAKPAPARKV